MIQAVKIIGTGLATTGLIGAGVGAGVGIGVAIGVLISSMLVFFNKEHFSNIGLLRTIGATLSSLIPFFKLGKVVNIGFTNKQLLGEGLEIVLNSNYLPYMVIFIYVLLSILILAIHLKPNMVYLINPMFNSSAFILAMSSVPCSAILHFDPHAYAWSLSTALVNAWNGLRRANGKLIHRSLPVDPDLKNALDERIGNRVSPEIYSRILAHAKQSYDL